MANERHRLKTVTNFGKSLLMDKLEYNLKTWLDWALLSVGAWNDVEIPNSTSFGGDMSRLRLTDDPNYTSGKVWEGVRKDWAWETDIDYGGSNNPISPAIIYVDNVVTNPSFINYSLGRVVFSSALTSSNVVKAEHSYRSVQVYVADECPWWNELQYGSFRADDPHFQQTETGSWSIGSHHRIQMPTIVLECVPRSTCKGAQLGDGSMWVEQDILLHIMAESRSSRNQLVDILRGQFDNTIPLFDSDLMAQDGVFPLDENGDIVDSSLIYPALVDRDDGYRWQLCKIIKTEVAEVQAFNSKLYQATVRWTCEVFLDD